jgi:hypothetical protein
LVTVVDGPYSDVERSKTTTDDIATTVREHLEHPRVRTPLPFDGVTLADLPMTTRPSPADLSTAATGVTAVDSPTRSTARSSCHPATTAPSR